MDLAKHYNQLWAESFEKFRNGKFECDPYLRGKKDRRYGLTLRAVPSAEVKANLTYVLDDIKTSATEQYFYPKTDMHITILSVISCYAGFTLDAINPGVYVDVIQRVTKNVAPFKIRFRGLTASPSCILVQGFPEDNQLNHLRDSLRKAFNQSGLCPSIDERYQLQTAHITAIRFRRLPNHPKKFIEKITGYRDYDFGRSTINELELVGNDWYQQAEKVQMVQRFSLAL